MTESLPSARPARLAGQFRDLVLTTLAVVIIATAVVVGVGRALLPHADALRPWLEAHLSERVGQPVAIERVQAQWPRLTPSLSLGGVRVGNEQTEALEVDALRVEFHLPNLVDGRVNFMRLVVLGPELVLAADDDGRWGVELAAGVMIRGAVSETRLPGADVLIRDGRLRLRPRPGLELLLRVPEGGIERSGDQTLLYGTVQPGSDPSERSGIRMRLEHPEGRWRSAEGWLGIEDLALTDWLPDLAGLPGLADTRTSLEGWLHWSAANDHLRLDLDFDLRPDAGQSGLAGQALLVRDGRTAQLQIEHLTDGAASIGAGLAVGRAGEVWALAIDRLDLAAVHAVLTPWLGALEAWPATAAGVIEGVELAGDRRGSVHAAAGRVEQLSVAVPDPWPTIDGLDLSFERLGDRLVVAPSGHPTVRWPHVLRGLIELDEIAGRVLLSPGGVELDGVRMAGPVASASADGWIHFDGPRPFLDLFIRADRIGPIDPRPYLPHRIIPPPAMGWLEQALVQVDQASGHVNLHMRAGTRTRNLHPGSYQARVDFRGVELDYWPDWPLASELSGQVDFIGRRLTGRLDQARLGTIDLQVDKVGIDDLVAPELTLDLVSERIEVGDLASTLAGIPMAGWQAVLAPMRWSGPADLAASLHLPFRRMNNWAIDGTARLDGTDLSLPAINARFSDLSATVAFDQAGIAPLQLTAELAGQPVTLAVAAGFQAPAWLELAGELNPADLWPQSGLSGALGERTEGRSAWRYRLESADKGAVRMHLTGDLEGLALDWPAPFAKPAPAVWPLAAELIMANDRLDLEIRAEQLLSGRLSLAGQRWSMSLGLGEQTPVLPVPDGVTVVGAVDAVALDEWLGLIELAEDSAATPVWPPRTKIDLAADRFGLAGLTTGAGRLAVDRTDATLRLDLDSPELAGSLSVPTGDDAGRAVVADLARLYLPASLDQTLADELAEQPLARQTSRFSPAGLPALSMVIEDLRRADLALGRLRLEAHPVPEGLEIELFDVNGPDLRVQGAGRWIDTETGPRSHFTGRVGTPSLSALLNSAGYDPGIEASRSQVDLDVRWPGAPQDFAMSRLLGQLDLRMNDGQIPEARPGAGRLLGLVSFNAIPRRLMLDFRDVFSPGMRFDDIVGIFELAEGMARTDGLILRAPAAVITITGQTDMIAREYDQTLRVEPGLGSSLPVIGGLAGGPVGAAAGLVLRQLLDRPLREVAEARYRITGSWDDPQIELVDAQVIDDQASPAPPERD
ncbi:MAG: YhdP family protein [Wenzhouxiangella sp.]